jgi:hypothetical protein
MQPISSKLLQVLVVLSRVCCPSTIEFEERFLNLMSSFSRILEPMLDAFWPLCFGTRRALPWQLIAWLLVWLIDWWLGVMELYNR